MSAGCSVTTPPISLDCSDPAYRAAHPEECAAFTILILAPDQGLIQVGHTIEYTVLLRANGKETTLTKGLEWTSSNVGAAVINSNGVATGVAAGQTNISVTWQNLSAQAQLDVVASCADTNQNFRILIDNSPSMGQSFSASYSTKLAFSKSIARDFCDTINYSKDKVAVSSFNDDYDELQTWASAATTPKSAIAGIALSTGKTNLADALSAAVDGFTGETGVRVIVLFTDGQWTGDDPKPVAQAFRESGGFLVIVATQAFNNSGSTEGKWFSDLFTMASGGFLLSAYGATEDDILASLSGLKSFICSGGCTPEPGTAPTAQLNYTGFINWDVTAGRVDLIGNGLWDAQAGTGHALYVDLQGTGDGNIPSPGEDFGLGQLTSKVEYDFAAGKDYSFSIDVGGSAAGLGTWTIQITVGDQVFAPITIVNAAAPFATHVFDWTQSGDFTGPIIIEQTVQTGHHNVGTLIDNILLRNETDDAVMLEDDFDSENPVTIPPGDGSSNYGCLESPPGTQTSDPSPPGFLEE